MERAWDGRIDCGTDGLAVGQVDGWWDGWIGRGADGLAVGRVDGWWGKLD